MNFTTLSVLLALFIFTQISGANDDRIVAHWKFEKIENEGIEESVNRSYSKISGFQKLINGVSGSGLLYDGYTTYISVPAGSSPQLTESFTLEAWIAVQAYPWNWVGILDQKKDSTAGYYFGVDANGYLCLQVAVNGQIKTAVSKDKIKLLKWTHITGIFNNNEGITLYINGKQTGNLEVSGKYTPAFETDLLIGRNNKKMAPAYPIRLDLPASYSFDGVVDEVKIYDLSLNAESVKQNFLESRPVNELGLSFRKMPAGPDGPGRFGAYYTNLKFSETWDAPWRVGPHADIVVRFDEASYKFVFWRGTSYIPCWVTETGIWYTNEFNETWGEDVMGCAEPMSDKQTRQSHVRIIESSDARVVVHWRYALVDNRGIIAKTDPVSGWGDWSDEYYTIYPDGVGLRKIHLWTSQPTMPHQFQEAIILNPPGTRPEDNIETEAITMMNMKGEMYTYSWAEGAPDEISKPDNFNIQFVNLKSKSRPFVVVNEGKPSVTRRNIETEGPWLRPYSGEINREYSIFPWWNHWPVAQIPSDGRWATEPDRVSHSSLSNDLEWKELELTERSHVRVMMHGLTSKKEEEILPIANAWLYPPELIIEGTSYKNESYREEERAFIITKTNPSENADLQFELNASDNHPLFNPAFIINNWGEKDAELYVNNKKVKRGKDFRYGHRHNLAGSDLIVWLRYDSAESVKILIKPQLN